MRVRDPIQCHLFSRQAFGVQTGVPLRAWVKVYRQAAPSDLIESQQRAARQVNVNASSREIAQKGPAWFDHLDGRNMGHHLLSGPLRVQEQPGQHGSTHTGQHNAVPRPSQRTPESKNGSHRTRIGLVHKLIPTLKCSRHCRTSRPYATSNFKGPTGLRQRTPAP